MQINFWANLTLKYICTDGSYRRGGEMSVGRWYRGFVLLGWMYRQIRVPRRTRQICHIRGEQSEPAARISRYAAPSKGQARVVGSDIDSLNRRTMSLVVLIKTRQDGSWTVAASSASRRRMYARWPRPRPLCFSRWTGILVRSFVITRLFYIRKSNRESVRSRFFRLIHEIRDF